MYDLKMRKNKTFSILLMRAMKSVEKFIKIEALKNALRFKGPANEKVILGRVMAEFAEYRTKKDEIIPVIKKIAAEVNALSEEMQTKQLTQLDSKALDDVPKKRSRKKDYPFT